MSYIRRFMFMFFLSQRRSTEQFSMVRTDADAIVLVNMLHRVLVACTIQTSLFRSLDICHAHQHGHVRKYIVYVTREKYSNQYYSINQNENKLWITYASEHVWFEMIRSKEKITLVSVKKSVQMTILMMIIITIINSLACVCISIYVT